MKLLLQLRPAPQHHLHRGKEGTRTAPGAGKAGEVCLSQPWFGYAAPAKPVADMELRGTPSHLAGGAQGRQRGLPLPRGAVLLSDR